MLGVGFPCRVLLGYDCLGADGIIAGARVVGVAVEVAWLWSSSPSAGGYLLSRAASLRDLLWSNQLFLASYAMTKITFTQNVTDKGAGKPPLIRIVNF